MKQTVIFCGAFPYIKYALTVAKLNYPGSKITIVVPHRLLGFFNLINERVFNSEIHVVYMEHYQGRIQSNIKRLKKAVYLLPEIRNEGQYLKTFYNKHFSRFRGAEIYFFSRYYSQYPYYFLKRLSKANRLVFMAHEMWDVLEIEQYTPRDGMGLAMLAIMKLTFGWDITLARLPYSKGIAAMPDSFIKNRVSRIIGREERDEMLKNFDWEQYKVFDNEKYSVLYFDSIPAKVGYIDDYNTHKQELTEVFDILYKYFPEDEIACKDYPLATGDVSSMGIANVVGRFIPAELFHSNEVRLYLSINSGAIANIENGLAVSIMDLITWKSEEAKKKLKEFFIKSSKSEILFPQSLEEFEDIVARASRAESAVASGNE